MSWVGPMKLDDLNDLDRDAFTAHLGHVFEHSPWVASRAHASRPFASVDDLHGRMVEVVRAADEAAILALLRAHPELAGREALEGSLTTASTGEQGRLGLNALNPEEQRTLEELNRHYRERFGFPCIIALRGHDRRESVFAEHRRRLGRDRAAEIAASLEQIGIIARGRLGSLVTDVPSGAAP